MTPPPIRSWLAIWVEKVTDLRSFHARRTVHDQIIMKQSRLLLGVRACLIGRVSITMHAISISGQGTWETTLQGRDLDGNLNTFKAYYDTVLNITWLADATSRVWSNKCLLTMFIYRVSEEARPNHIDLSGGIMNNYWVVVADQSKARIFSVADSRSALLEVGVLEHPEARELEQTLTSDRPGRAFDTKGRGRHAMGSTVEPGKQENLRFARQVADHLLAAHNEGRCDRLLLVAGPPLLGLLKDNLDTSSGLEVSVLEKNLGQYDAQEIRKHLPERL